MNVGARPHKRNECKSRNGVTRLAAPLAVQRRFRL
jgi:hypothetical protein